MQKPEALPVKLAKRWRMHKSYFISFIKVNPIFCCNVSIFVNDKELLSEYRKKRDFSSSPEPNGKVSKSSSAPIFVIQKHAASNLHYDLRLESEGVLKSWAIPKGPSMDPSIKRLAVPTEDHPIAYADFEGVIPEGHYGAGAVIVWDSGVFRNTKGEDASFAESLSNGHATIFLVGTKLKGDFALIRTGRGGKRLQWLFFKMKDKYAEPGSDITRELPSSSKTGRSLDEVAEQELPANLDDFM